MLHGEIGVGNRDSVRISNYRFNCCRSMVTYLLVFGVFEMSEDDVSKGRRIKVKTNLWAINVYRVNDPILEALDLHARGSPARYVRIDQTVVKGRVLNDLIVCALRGLYPNDSEIVKLVNQHVREEEQRATILTGKPMPAAMPALHSAMHAGVAMPEPTEIPPPRIQPEIAQSSAASPSTVPPHPTAPTPTPEPKLPPKRKVVNLIVDESGHSRLR